MGTKWKSMVKKVIAKGVLAGFLVLFAGLPQIEPGEQQPLRTEPGVESEIGELPEGEGGEEGIRPCVDLEEEEELYY